MYFGVTSEGVPDRVRKHEMKQPTVVGEAVTRLIPKVGAGIMEWAGIRQMHKLIDAGLVAEMWNVAEGLERVTYGRDIDYFEVYAAKATSVGK